MGRACFDCGWIACGSTSPTTSMPPSTIIFFSIGSSLSRGLATISSPRRARTQVPGFHPRRGRPGDRSRRLPLGAVEAVALAKVLFGRDRDADRLANAELRLLELELVLAARHAEVDH